MFQLVREIQTLNFNVFIQSEQCKIIVAEKEKFKLFLDLE